MKWKMKNISWGRIAMMFAGNVFLGMGISIFKLSGLGNDPFSGMVMALASVVGIVYANFLILLNLGLFAVQLAVGRKYIGPGTVVNAVLLGYFVTFFYNIWIRLFGVLTAMPVRLFTVCIGVLVVSFGLALYQTSDQGVAPYDYLALGMRDRWSRIPYFWHRILCDAICALICWLAGGIVGLGTLICAFGLGPFVSFFDRLVARRLVSRLK